jgi:60 kDa SS-A/Ro ribonucleoprotein
MKNSTYFNALTRTSQRDPIPGRNDMVENNAGGYTFAVDTWTRLRRFLILGSERPTYYVNERKHTADNLTAVTRAIAENPARVLEMIREVSTNRLAPKNTPALFTLAMAIARIPGKNPASFAAKCMVGEIARHATDFFIFLTYLQEMRGWGRSITHMAASWYLNRDINSLAYQVTKYRNREGWTHRDVLRMCHAKPRTAEQQDVFAWVVRGDIDAGMRVPALRPFLQLQAATDVNTVISLLSENHSLTWEMVPTIFLRDARVWETLIPHMPMMALIRNLARMTASGALIPMSDSAKTVQNRIMQLEENLHPIFLLNALLTYRSGHGERGSLTWNPVPGIDGALEHAFNNSFRRIVPSGKNYFLGLDVSGSMYGTTIPGMSLDCATAAAVMAMATVRVEENTFTASFSAAGSDGHAPGRMSGIESFPMTRESSLDAVLNIARRFAHHMKRTDCSLPMIYALRNRIPVDVFVIYTDNETYAGDIHPVQALKQYRREMNRPGAKLIVCAFTATEFSIADPEDPGMLDVVGFDASTPAVISSF